MATALPLTLYPPVAKRLGSTKLQVQIACSTETWLTKIQIIIIMVIVIVIIIVIIIFVVDEQMVIMISS